MTTEVHVQAFTTLTDLEAGFELMKILRPTLVSPSLFAKQIERQIQHNYHLLGAVQNGKVVGLIGYRHLENLLYGRFVYVDDLVVDPDARHLGLGARLLDYVREQAIAQGCAHYVLDTGLHMALAQKFYYREGLLARGMHFVQALKA